jgi:UvrD-like helicase family protein
MGQEWKSVFVLNVVDGCILDLGTGTSAEIEEERRLLYVAMTHAKDDLHLIVPQRFFTHGQTAQGDRHVYACRTRFIPDGLLGLFERTAWPMMAPGLAVRPATEGVRVDVGARMRGGPAPAAPRSGQPRASAGSPDPATRSRGFSTKRSRGTPRRPIRQHRPSGGPFIPLGSSNHDPATCLNSERIDPSEAKS